MNPSPGRGRPNPGSCRGAFSTPALAPAGAENVAPVDSHNYHILMEFSCLPRSFISHPNPSHDISIPTATLVC